MPDDTPPLPKAAWSGEFTLLGVKLKCHVLEDGQHIIEADSVANFLNAIATSSPGASTVDDARDAELLAAWIKGGPWGPQERPEASTQ